MKKHVLLILFAIMYSVTFSQSETNFKNIEKKQSGTVSHEFTSKTISHGSQSNSGVINSSNSSFLVSNNLKQPCINHAIIVGVPTFFQKEKLKLKSYSTETIDQQFYTFHTNAKQTTKLKNPEKELIIKQKNIDELGITHIKAQQFFKGVKVYGAESYVHLGSQKDVFTGYIYVIDSNFNVIPTISKESALHTVEFDIQTKTIYKKLSDKEKEILNYNSAQITLVIFNQLLAYEIIIRPNFIEEWKYFVNAQTGQIVTGFNNTNSDGPATANAYDLNNMLRTINTYLETGTYVLENASEAMYNATTGEGIIQTLDANNTSAVDLNYTIITSTTNTWTSKAAVSAHYNATASYKYFENTFGRNSINGQGGNIISFINVTEDDGSSMENAFWNGRAAFYGNGGSYFYPLAGALDVTAHELGHGIVSNTANLDYEDHSCSINESYADIFGAMVDRDDWLIGEDITKTTFFPSGALRNMSDPHNLGTSVDYYWQPNHVSEMYLGNEDNGGVHINSGIGNYAYYLFATAVTKNKAEQVFYRALSYYLTSRSQFTDLRIAVLQSAKDLYGDNSQEAIEVGIAFDAVGISDEISVDYEQDYPVNPGQEYLLSYDTNPLNSNTLYRSSTTGEAFAPLTTTQMKGRVCASDDGSIAVFVSETEDKIKFISLDPNDIQEDYLSDDAFFDNVTLSKDGNRLAAISIEEDASIYVYDFNLQQWATFHLYNPTTSETGNDAGGVLYADAIEFDHTGEYIMYDALNVFNSTLNGQISYWDIGFIKVWDNTTNSFGDGTITKLYSSLPEDICIGNPTFSKNSSDIIAFDYLDNSTGEFAIVGANILTGDLDVITMNSMLGYPSFSKNDDKIAFSTRDYYNEYAIAVKNLDANKITGVGLESIIVNNAVWPVFYSVGTRVLDLAPITNFTVDAKSGIAPFAVQFIDLTQNNPNSWSWVFNGGTPGNSNVQNPTVTYNTPGVYSVSLTASNSVGNNAVTKTSYIHVLSELGIVNQVSELFSFYPCPTNSVLFIESEKDYKLKIYSLTGKLLIQVNNEKKIDLSKLTSGVYIMKIEIDGKIISDKIVKQ